MNMYYLICFVGMLEQLQPDGSRPWSPMRSQSGCWPGLWATGDSVGAGEYNSNMADAHGLWVSVDCWQEVSISHQLDPSLGLLECPYDMAAGSLWSEWSKRAMWKLQYIYDLASEFTLSFLQNLFDSQLSRPSVFLVGGACTRVWLPGGRDHWGSSWRFVTIPPI